MTITATQWKTAFGVVAAVCAFLLAQPDITLAPWSKVILGAVITALAVLNPDRSATDG